MAKLTYHGHATLSIECSDGTQLVVDPFFADNAACPHDGSGVHAHFVLLTHGHGDHVGDVIPLVERTGAMVIASHEIATFLGGKGFTTSPQHIGGAVRYPFGRVKMTPALHGGKVELPGAEAFSTLPAGFLIELGEGPRVYIAGDTALIADMQLLEGRVDVAVLPIGDRFTMGPEDAVRAVDMIRPSVVIPYHYNTWPPIEQDAEAFAAAVGDRAEVKVLRPGESADL